MKNNNGFTLIEVIVSLMILSVSLIVFISLFGNTVTLIDKSKIITNETFELQEKMEKKIIEDKKAFVAGATEDYEISIFSGDYQVNVPVKEILETHSSGRKYVTIVSGIDIVEPKLPEVEYFSVGAYLNSDTDYINEVFPWYEDNIILGAKYKIRDDPVIFENRKRWYRSQDNIFNPVYRSQYDIVTEEFIEEPSSNFEVKTEITKSDDLLSNKFYYFELRPYTLAGRVAHFINESRIAVLNKPDSENWKEFIEGIYPRTSGGDTIKYSVDTGDGEKVYSEVMQNREVATLDLEWSKNEDPEGALVGMKVPNLYSTHNYSAEIEFQVDSDALVEQQKLEVDQQKLGLGVFLGNDSNKGDMITFDVIENKIIVNSINSGDYSGANILEINLMTDSRFTSFIKDSAFVWDELLKINVIYLRDTSKIGFKLSYDDEGTIIESELIEFDDTYTDYSYVGLKAYSSLDYIINDPDNMLNEYERNYAVHFYNLDFHSSEIMEITDGYFVDDADDNKIIIEFDQDIESDIKVDEDLDGNGTIEDSERYIFFEDDSVIDSVTKTDSNQITIYLDDSLTIPDKYFGKKLYLKLGGIETIDSGYIDIVNADPYEIKLDIKYILDEDFENYTDSADFATEYASESGWNKYRNGNVEFALDGTNKCLKKIDNNDPHGAYKLLSQTIDDEFFIADVKIMRINKTGGSQDRFSISKKGTDNAIEGYGVAITGSSLEIEKRSGNGTASSLASDSYGRTSDVWYRIIFFYEPSTNKLTAQVYDELDVLIEEVDVINNDFTEFDGFFIHGGHDYLIDDIKVGILN